MTIPEISPFLIISMCGLSVVCIGLFAIVGLLAVRFLAGDLWDTLTGLVDRGSGSDVVREHQPQRLQRGSLRERAASSLDFDSAVGGSTAQTATSRRGGEFGENASLRPDKRSRFNEKTRDWDLAPPGRMSDDPRNMHAPPPPDFNPNNKSLPNTRSNIGGRVGRHNTGRGQTGQRMDSSSFSSSVSGGGSGRSLRSDRNARRDDEFFGGKADFDGDGDVDT